MPLTLAPKKISDSASYNSKVNMFDEPAIPTTYRKFRKLEGKQRLFSLAFFHIFSRRFHLTIILMLGYFCTNYMRTNLGMTMTCMVNSTALAVEENKQANSTDNVQMTGCKYSSADGYGVNDYGVRGKKLTKASLPLLRLIL